MAKQLLLSQPEERNHKLQKLPSDKENKGALALSTWGEKTTNCKSFLAKRRWQRGADWCSQPKKENKPHIVAAAQLVEKEDPQPAHNTANEEI